VVVDHHVQVLEAGHRPPLAVDLALELARAMAEDAVAGAALGDPAELFDVDVDEFARVAALVPVRRLRRACAFFCVSVGG